VVTGSKKATGGRHVSSSPSIQYLRMRWPNWIPVLLSTASRYSFLINKMAASWGNTVHTFVNLNHGILYVMSMGGPIVSRYDFYC
jgi:hypothetical protein